MLSFPEHNHSIIYLLPLFWGWVARAAAWAGMPKLRSPQTFPADPKTVPGQPSDITPSPQPVLCLLLGHSPLKMEESITWLPFSPKQRTATKHNPQNPSPLRWRLGMKSLWPTFIGPCMARIFEVMPSWSRGMLWLSWGLQQTKASTGTVLDRHVIITCGFKDKPNYHDTRSANEVTDPQSRADDQLCTVHIHTYRQFRFSNSPIPQMHIFWLWV